MLKYILFLMIGILIFILLNHNENFYIGNQFSTDPDQIERFDSISFYTNLHECSSEVRDCVQLLRDRGGACALFQLLKFYAIQGEEITLDELEIIVSRYNISTSRTNILEVLNILGENGESMKKILNKSGIDTSSSLECVEVELAYISLTPSSYTVAAYKILDEYLEDKELYLAFMNLKFEAGAVPMMPTAVETGHTFLIYKNKNSDEQIIYTIFDGCNPDLHVIISTDNHNNLYNIYSYWITKFNINRELITQCYIGLFIYQNKKAVCAPPIGGGYGGIGGGGYSPSGGAAGPASGGDDERDRIRDSILANDIIISDVTRDYATRFNTIIIENDYTYNESQDVLYLNVVPSDKIGDINEAFAHLYEERVDDEGNISFRYVG